MEHQSLFKRALLTMDKVEALAIMNELLECNTPIQVVESLISPVLEELGLGWEQGNIALSQIYMAGILCEEIIEAVLPPVSGDDLPEPRVAICVLEDHHVLGKRVVSSAVRAGGFQLLDYGHGVDVDDLISWVQRDRIQLLLISVLMLRSALKVKDLRQGLEACGYNLRIAVGGAPFRLDHNLWRRVGADTMGRNYADALNIVRDFLRGGKENWQQGQK